MREQFTKQLTELRQELIAIYTEIDLNLHRAVDSLVAGDKQQARAVKKATRVIDKRCAALEDSTYQLIALQNPLASDLRLLQFIIFVNFNLARMSNHVRNIAKTTKRASDKQIPPQLLDLLQGQANLVYMVLSATVKSIVENDLAEAAELPELDKPVNALYKSFYKVFSQLRTEEEISAASRILMASRMLERISDNAVEVGERVVFLLTGNREPLDTLADLDEEELEDLYVGQNPSLHKGTKKIEKMTSKIPEVAHTQEVMARVQKALKLAHQKNPFEESSKKKSH